MAWEKIRYPSCPNCSVVVFEPYKSQERWVFHWFWGIMILVSGFHGGCEQVGKPPYRPGLFGVLFILSIFISISYHLGRVFNFIKFEELIPEEEVRTNPKRLRFSIWRFLREFLYMPLVVGLVFLLFLLAELLRQTYS